MMLPVYSISTCSTSTGTLYAVLLQKTEVSDAACLLACTLDVLLSSVTRHVKLITAPLTRPFDMSAACTAGVTFHSGLIVQILE